MTHATAVTRPPSRGPRRPRPDRPAARRAARPPAAAAVRRAGALRRLAGADGPRRPRPRALGRAALRPDPAPADHARPGASWSMSFVVLLLWIPLREMPGLGTISNAIVVGVVRRRDPRAARPARRAGGARSRSRSAASPSAGWPPRIYIGAQLGRGPRDGLMTGLARRTGLSLRLVRTGLEVTVVAHRPAARRRRRPRHRRSTPSPSARSPSSCSRPDRRRGLATRRGLTWRPRSEEWRSPCVTIASSARLGVSDLGGRAVSAGWR